MASYTVGDVIHDNRKARGYSQEALSFGICSVSSLSKIENNIQSPTKRVFDALMQRLGVSDSFYNVYISKEEMELYRALRDILGILGHYRLEKLEEAIADAEERMTPIREPRSLEWQFLFYAKAHLCTYKGGTRRDSLNLLLKAIHITMPKFNVNHLIKRKLLTFDEIAILNSIALNIYEDDMHWEALRILFDLKEYLEEHVIDEEEMAKWYPTILYNITSRIGLDFHRHEDVIELCDLGISCCVQYGKLLSLPYLLNNKAFAYAELSDMETAKELFYQAISLFNVCKQEDSARIIKDEIRAKYNISL